MNKVSDFFDQTHYFENEVTLPKSLLAMAIGQDILKDDTTLIMLKK
jgi:hypothetical protein